MEIANLIRSVKSAKTTNNDIRDRALLAFLVLTGMRISEALSVTYFQYDNRRNDKFILIKNVKILKRRKEPILKEFPLPKTGMLAELTEIIQKYVKSRDWHIADPLFPIGRHQAWKIINDMTGKWPHYFRSQRISYLMNEQRIQSAAVAKMLGIKQSSTIDHYLKSSWRNYEEELSK